MDRLHHAPSPALPCESYRHVNNILTVYFYAPAKRQNVYKGPSHIQKAAGIAAEQNIFTCRRREFTSTKCGSKAVVCLVCLFIIFFAKLIFFAIFICN